MKFSFFICIVHYLPKLLNKVSLKIFVVTKDSWKKSNATFWLVFVIQQGFWCPEIWLKLNEFPNEIILKSQLAKKKEIKKVIKFLMILVVKKEDFNRFLFWIRPYFIFDPHPRLLQSKLKGTQKYRTFVIRIGRFFLTQMVHGGLASSSRDCNLIRDTIGWNYFRSSTYQHFLAPRHFNEFFTQYTTYIYTI